MGASQLAALIDEVRTNQRTERGMLYERWVRSACDRFQNDNAFREKLGRQLLSIRGVSPSAVHSNQFLSNMSVRYANDDFIGLRLMPRVPVSNRSNTYLVYPRRERMAFPDDKITERGRAAELNETRQTDNYSVKDYALQNFVDAETIDNQDPPFDEMVELVESVNYGLAFNEEKRIASILTTGANYAGNTVALSGSSTWDSAGGGDPVANLMNIRASLWNGTSPTRKIAFSGLDVFLTLARHPAIRELFKYTQDGLATPQQIARYFGFDDYLVGETREDTANSGQTVANGRIWGKVFGVVRVATRPSRSGVWFGSTFFKKDDPKSFQWFDPAVGKGGGYYFKSGLSEDHKIVAPDTGFLYTGVIA